MNTNSTAHSKVVLLDFVSADEIVALGAAVAAELGDTTLSQRLFNEVAVYGKGRVSPELTLKIASMAASLANNCKTPRTLSGNDPLAAMLVATCTGTKVDEDERLMLLDQSGLLAAAPVSKQPEAATRRVAVIGAGISGISMGRELLEAGYDVTVFERTGRCSGTWSQNLYPGCGVDSPSYVYAFSYAQKPDWSRYFVRRAEIDSYIEECATEFGVRPHIRFDTAVVSCRYDSERCLWRVVTQHPGGPQKTEEFHAVVSAVGQLNTPAYPAIEGLESFKGPVVHTAEWDESLNLTGKRVAVIGVGASAMQVVPTIAPVVSHLSVFQRQPHWVMPNSYYLAEVSAEEIERLRAFPSYLAWKRLVFNWTYGDAAFAALTRDAEWPADARDAVNPYSARLRDMMREHIRRELTSYPELVDKMTPHYPPYSKRVLLDNNWYKTFLRDNVSLVTNDIARITEDGIETCDGHHQSVDVIILATGFHASRMLSTYEIENSKGQTLRDSWHSDNPRAYMGVTIPGFPNLFLIYGPNTNLAFGGSAIIHSEIQSRYIVQCLDLMLRNGKDAMECKSDAFQAYNDVIDAKLRGMVWSDEGSTNWFRNSAGRVTTNSPWSMGQYWARMRMPKISSFRFENKYKSKQKKCSSH